MIYYIHQQPTPDGPVTLTAFDFIDSKEPSGILLVYPDRMDAEVALKYLRLQGLDWRIHAESNMVAFLKDRGWITHVNLTSLAGTELIPINDFVETLTDT